MTDIVDNPFTLTPGTVHQGIKRVRAFSSGELVVDSRSPLQVWEHPYYPQYFFAESDLEVELAANGNGPRSKVLGVSEVFDVLIGDRVLPRAARRYPQAGVEGLRDAIGLTWAAFDTWMEEDEIVYTHPRSPYVRIDALASSRHVVVRFRDVIVAESHRPVMLFETGLDPRFYLPQADVRLDLLVPSATTSHCPYKGTATYWNLATGDASLTDVAWVYRTPLPESAKIAGLVAFWPEKSPELEVTVDGQRLGAPRHRPGRVRREASPGWTSVPALSSSARVDLGLRRAAPSTLRFCSSALPMASLQTPGRRICGSGVVAVGRVSAGVWRPVSLAPPVRWPRRR